MKFSRRRVLQLTATGTLATALPDMAPAQSYPAHPVRLIVPYAPGGPNDILARLAAQKLSERLGKQFYVENIAGAGGNLGIAQAAKAPPDGHTVIVVPPNIVVNPLLYPSVAYDPFKDFEPITAAVAATIVLAVHPSLPVTTVKDLVALVKFNPPKFSFASPGTATPPHLVGEQFRLSLGLDLPHVPFNSGGLAISSAVAGHTPIVFCSLPPATPHIKDGTLRGLAVTSRVRSQALPGVPTIAEAGYPGIEGEGWFAFIVPAGTPKEITALLHREIVRIIALPDIKERLDALGFVPMGNTPSECAALFKAESLKWAEVIRNAGIKATN